MSELSLFKLNSKIQFLDKTFKYEILSSNWNNDNTYVITLDLSDCNGIPNVGGLRAIIGLDYSYDDTNTKITEISNANLSIFVDDIENKRCRITLKREQVITSNFYITINVQGIATQVNDSSIINTFPRKSGNNTSIKIGNDTLDGVITFANGTNTSVRHSGNTVMIDSSSSSIPNSSIKVGNDVLTGTIELKSSGTTSIDKDLTNNTITIKSPSSSSIKVGNTTLTGTVELKGGSNTTVTNSGNIVTIATTGGGGSTGVSGITLNGDTSIIYDGQIDFNGAVVGDNNTNFTFLDEKVKLIDWITTGHQNPKFALIFSKEQNNSITNNNSYNLCYDYNVKNSLYVMPNEQRIYAKKIHDTYFSKNHLWMSNGIYFNCSDFDKYGNTFEIGIRNNNTQTDKTNISQHKEWISRIKFSPASGTKKDRITIDTPLLKIKTDKIDIDNGKSTNSFISAQKSKLKIKTIEGVGEGNNRISELTNFAKVNATIINAGELFTLNGKDLFDLFKTLFGSQGTCIIGYANDPFSEYYTYTIPATNGGRTPTDTVLERAQRFSNILRTALNDNRNFKEILLMPGLYYLSGINNFELNKSNFTLRGLGSDTSIIWSEQNLFNTGSGAANRNGMLKITGGNVAIKDLTISYYLSDNTQSNVEQGASDINGYANTTYTNSSLIYVTKTGFELRNVHFSSYVLENCNCTDPNRLVDNAFTYTDNDGLTMNKADDQSNTKLHTSDRRYALAQAIYLENTNAGIYECVFDDKFTKYMIYRNISTSCASTVVGCRCIAEKPWYSMNVPVTGCTAYDSNIETTSTNTNGWESPAVFEIKNH